MTTASAVLSLLAVSRVSAHLFLRAMLLIQPVSQHQHPLECQSLPVCAVHSLFPSARPFGSLSNFINHTLFFTFVLVCDIVFKLLSARTSGLTLGSLLRCNECISQQQYPILDLRRERIIFCAVG